MDGFLRQAWKEVSERWGQAQRATALWQPSLPTAPWLTPGVALGALIALVLLAGVSLLALGVLLTALLLSYLIVANVFGVTIEVASR